MAAMDYCFGLIVAISFLARASECAAVAENILNLCHRSDPNLDECIKKSAISLKPKLKNGIKQLKITPMDPFSIPKIELRQGTGPVALNTVFTDVVLEGLTDFDIKKLHLDLDKRELYVEGFHPTIRGKSKYVTDGKILSLPIKGDGDSYSTYNGVSSQLSMKFKPETKNGKEYWKLDTSDYNIDIKSGQIHFDNLFNGNKQLGDTMNAFIAENWDVIFEELKPVVREIINTFIKDLVLKMYDSYSIDELFPQ